MNSEVINLIAELKNIYIDISNHLISELNGFENQMSKYYIEVDTQVLQRIIGLLDIIQEYIMNIKVYLKNLKLIEKKKFLTILDFSQINELKDEINLINNFTNNTMVSLRDIHTNLVVKERNK